MPLGKYYCDYCDKQFQDTPAARKRHLQGTQHQRARALWYDSVRHQDQHGGGSPLLLPDGTLAKGVCHHFVRTIGLTSSINLYHSGPGPGASVQQSNFLGSQPNFVGYQAVEQNSFSGT
nr:unnamed protein product [Digitaria exilis]